ncbi:MAG: hypothetical protein ACI4ET_01955, partial [Bilifractor sp.]
APRAAEFLVQTELKLRIREHRDKYILQESESKLLLSRDLLECKNQNVREQANMILLNMPEMFGPEGESGGQA